MKYLLVICTVAAFIGGYYFPREPETKYVERILDYSDFTIYDHSTTTTSRAPGGAEERVVVRDVVTHGAAQHQAVLESTTRTLVSTPAAQYSIGAARVFPGAKSDSRAYYSITAGRRLVGPVWGEIGYSTYNNTVTLGGRMEF